MSLVLSITSGSRAGQRAEFTKSVVVVGRHPDCDLRFDVNKDLDVSTRHAELRGAVNGWSVFDLGSTNGTFVNGAKATGPQTIRVGDVIMFGSSGPRVEVVGTGVVDLAATPRTQMRDSVGTSNRPKTEERIAIAVAKQTGSLKKFVVGLGVVVILGVGALVAVNQRSTARSNEIIAQLLSKNDSLLAATKGREAGLDSAAHALRVDRENLAKAIKSGSGVTQSQIDALDKRTRGVMSAANVNWAQQVSARNNAAVAYVVVQAQSDSVFSGTAFGILPSGLMVTNKHVVSEDGKPPKQIAIKFADTHNFIPGRFVRLVDGNPDLAFIEVVAKGEYPTVMGIASSTSVSVGEAAAIIGYPLGTTLPMDGEGATATAKTTLTAGLISKSIASDLQLDAFAAQGSSGSPVFNAQGFVIGVVYSGATEAGGRVVFAVPSAHLIANLPANAKSIVKP